MRYEVMDKKCKDSETLYWVRIYDGVSYNDKILTYSELLKLQESL